MVTSPLAWNSMKQTRSPRQAPGTCVFSQTTSMPLRPPPRHHRHPPPPPHPTWPPRHSCSSSTLASQNLSFFAEGRRTCFAFITGTYLLLLTPHLGPPAPGASLCTRRRLSPSRLKIVISTEETHSFIVSRAVERSPHFAFTVACSFVVRSLVACSLIVYRKIAIRYRKITIRTEAHLV